MIFRGISCKSDLYHFHLSKNVKFGFDELDNRLSESHNGH